MTQAAQDGETRSAVHSTFSALFVPIAPILLVVTAHATARHLRSIRPYGVALIVLLLTSASGFCQQLFDPDPYDYPLWNLLNRPIMGPERGKFEVNYVYWYLQKLRVPPLVTTGPEGSDAVLGEPGTVVLRGGNRLKSRHGRFIGFRNTAEYWLTDRVGLDATVFILERDSSNLTYRHHQYTPLARPYVDAATGENRSEVIAGFVPGLGNLAGSINVYSRVEVFGQDANILYRWRTGENYHWNAIVGARFLQMRERLDITATSFVQPAETTVYGQADHFQTFMKFFGAQTGFTGEIRRGDWFIAAKGALALGADVQIVRAKGDRVIHPPEGRETRPYGLYVLPSNTGHFERTVLDFVTEWQINIGYMLAPRLRARIGYSLLTWNNPVRPGDQIEPLDLSQLNPEAPPGQSPAMKFRSDFFWAQGLNFGVEARW